MLDRPIPILINTKHICVSFSTPQQNQSLPLSAAGTLLNQIQRFITDPSAFLTVLGTATPQTANFFILYVTFIALIMKPLSLLRVPLLVIFWIR